MDPLEPEPAPSVSPLAPEAEPAPDPSPDPARRRDPLAAALANASLLGAGYLFLGRRRPAAANLAVTVVLVTLLASGERPGWLRAAVPVWWVAVTAHGWWLAGGRPRRSATVRLWWHRLAALLLTGPVLLAFAALRADAAGIERDAAAAHRDGDCARALSLLDGLWAGHRAADGRLFARAGNSTEACELLLEAERQASRNRLGAEQTLRTYEEHPAALWEGAPERRAELVLAEAAEEFDTALTGDTGALSTGFGHLSTVLAEFPAQEDAVGEVLDGFLGQLPRDNACTTRRITTWLGNRADSGDVLDRAADVVPELEPAAIVGCADEALGNESWGPARDTYEQLLDEYPGHALTADAERGIDTAETAIELDRLRELVQTSSEDEEPAYCDDPAPYRGAAPYSGGGPYPALLFGQSDHVEDLPGGWLTDDPAEAVLVICAGGGQEYGSVVETCAYESESGSGYDNITFHSTRLSVRVYEVRTGRRLDTSTVEIGGSCPAIYTYTYYGTDTGPPSNDYAFATTDDIRAGYRPLIDP